VIRVYLESAKTWTFASAVDWPGWSRRGKGEDAAIDALLEYAERYRTVVGRAFRLEEISVIGRAPGTATTEFGAPDARGMWDDEPMDPTELRRQLGIVEKSWKYFDRVVAGAPPTLRKGPRGGGRDRDDVVDHVREAERAYGRKVGVRVPPRTPWEKQRSEILAGLRAGADDPGWRPRYLIRRLTWHVLDHAWEIEDKSD
jgi:hypothetical protein